MAGAVPGIDHDVVISVADVGIEYRLSRLVRLASELSVAIVIEDELRDGCAGGGSGVEGDPGRVDHRGSLGWGTNAHPRRRGSGAIGKSTGGEDCGKQEQQEGQEAFHLVTFQDQGASELC